jgi:hypothetical protein
MRLTRPYIPLRVRLQVAERQYKQRFGFWPDFTGNKATLGASLRAILRDLFDGRKVHLHHFPALCNRQIISSKSEGVVCYRPSANDPDHLTYIEADAHDVWTRVRGPHGDYSDLAKARKRKRVERKRKRPRRKLRGRGFDKTRSRKFSGQVVPR